MKATKHDAPIERNSLVSMDDETIFMARAADGTETFELETQTFLEERGGKWVPRESDFPRDGESSVLIERTRRLTRREALRWFVANLIPEELRKDFRPVTHPKKGGAR